MPPELAYQRAEIHLLSGRLLRKAGEVPAAADAWARAAACFAQAGSVRACEVRDMLGELADDSGAGGDE
jgi:hypothetical protein